jgi:hypothetical protein
MNSRIPEVTRYPKDNILVATDAVLCAVIPPDHHVITCNNPLCSKPIRPGEFFMRRFSWYYCEDCTNNELTGIIETSAYESILKGLEGYKKFKRKEKLNEISRTTRSG